MAISQPTSDGNVSGTGTFGYGDTVNLTANPKEGYSFLRWSGDASGSSNPLTLTVNQDFNITAVFEIKHNLVLSSKPDGAAYGMTGAGTFEKGSIQTIKATANPGYEFIGWTGDHSANTPTSTLALDSDMNITANFSLISYQVNAAAQPSGSGQVSGGGSFHYDDNATLTALPNSGYRFLQWEGNFTGGKKANPLTLIVTEDLNVTASFELIPYFAKSGTDLGNGWRSIDWFGAYFVMNASDWIYHLGHGWIYMVSDNPSSVWFFSNGTWKWTNSSIYPFAHDHSSNSWLYFQSTEEGMRHYHYGDKKWSDEMANNWTVASAANLEMIWVNQALL